MAVTQLAYGRLINQNEAQLGLDGADLSSEQLVPTAASQTFTTLAPSNCVARVVTDTACYVRVGEAPIDATNQALRQFLPANTHLFVGVKKDWSVAIVT